MFLAVGFPLVIFGVSLFGGSNSVNYTSSHSLVKVPDGTKSSTNVTIYVDPVQGNDRHSGSNTTPLQTIQKAVDIAQPGDTIVLAAGLYLQDIVSKRNGLLGAPITITGPPTAVIKGAGNARIIEIDHSYITLDGFTIDGLYGDPNTASGYRNKLVYVLGQENESGVTRVRLLNMTLRNSGGEAIRLRYFAYNNEIAYCNISNCGIYNFEFGGSGTYGEGIYIGTASDQVLQGENPTPSPDQCNDNWIHNNIIDTQGAECIDIKEASSGNIIDYNMLTGSKAINSGGISCRGNGNIFRNNEIYDNAGAGIRLGGDTQADGINNYVQNNNIHDNQAGGIKIMNEPQTMICGNTMSDNIGGNCVGIYSSHFDPAATCSH